MRGKRDEAKAVAKAAGEMFFVGRVCEHHPELAGRRRTSNGACPSCIRERMRETRRVRGREARDKELSRRKAIRAGTLVPRKYRKAGEVKP